MPIPSLMVRTILKQLLLIVLSIVPILLVLAVLVLLVILIVLVVLLVLTILIVVLRIVLVLIVVHFSSVSPSTDHLMPTVIGRRNMTVSPSTQGACP